MAVAAIAALSAQPVSAQAGEPDVMILAQAQDRCMATYAVRLTRTDATDEAIYATAAERCAATATQLDSAITARYPADQAPQLITTLHDQAKPNFLRLLARIRSDRATRGAD